MRTIAALVIAMPTVIGCGGGVAVNGGAGADAGPEPGTDAEPEPGTGGSAPVCAADGRIAITDDTNYSFSSHLDIGVTVARGGYDLVFDWSALTQDLRGRPLDPVEDIDLVTVSWWNLTPEELEATIDEDGLGTPSRTLLTAHPGDRGSDDPMTSVRLLELTVFRNEVPVDELWRRFDPSLPDYEYDGATFMLTAHTGEDPLSGIRMLGFFTLALDAPTTTVALTGTTTTLDYSASLTDIPRLAVPARTAELVVDWSQMTTTAMGSPYDETQITEAVVAHFVDLAPTDLETHFLSLPELASGWWSADVTAHNSKNLHELVDATGAPFSGIDPTGTWVVALFCTVNCINPAPWSITLLSPCE